MSLLTYDKTTKKVGPGEVYPGMLAEDLEAQIAQLNTLTQQLVHTTTDVPQGTQPTKALTIAIKACHEAGAKALRSGRHEEAIRAFSEGISKSISRNRWELFYVTLFETQMCLMSRTDAYLLTGQFDKALQDADFLIKTMSVHPENFFRRSMAYMQLGFLEQAKADLERGLAFSPGDEKLKKQLEIVLKRIDEDNGE